MATYIIELLMILFTLLVGLVTFGVGTLIWHVYKYITKGDI